MKTAALPLLLLGIAASAHADEVELLDGTLLVGKVEDLGETVCIRRRGGAVTYPKGMVKKITSGPLPEEVYLEKAASLKENDLDARLLLARWCVAHRIDEEARIEFAKVIAIDPDQEEARAALGYRRHEGTWKTEDEIRGSKGLVRHKGRWITPQEKEMEEALDRGKELDRELAKEIRRLLDRLNSSDEAKRAEARERLAAIADEIKLDPFLAATGSLHDATRLYVVRELGRMKSVSAVPRLVKRALFDDEEEIRDAALESLSSIGDPATWRLFAALLGEESATLRLRAVSALARFPDFGAAAPLLTILDEDVRALDFLEQYAEHVARILAGRLVLRNGRQVALPPRIRIDPGFFDPVNRERLRREIDAVLDTLRTISGKDHGRDLQAWSEWLEQERRKRAPKAEGPGPR